MTMDTQEQADELKQEAYDIIQKIFNVPDKFVDQRLNRLVDCIIASAVLQVAALHEKILKA